MFDLMLFRFGTRKKAADISKSSTHRGAEGKLGDVRRGIVLRFSRFERIRDDKRSDMATISQQILEMYYQQDSIVERDNAYDDDDGMYRK